MAYLNPLEQEIADIQQSWKRCYEFGLKPEEQADDQIVSERAVKELQQHYQFLFPHAEAVFAQLYPLITSYGCVVFLTDAEGTILYASGDASFASRAARVQLQVGANWHERKKGTNAIGVSLLEKKPAYVRGSEHFFRENHFLTCASAPIFDGKGQLLGVVNISGLEEQFHPSVANVVTLAADTLQNRLLIEQMGAEQLVTLRHLETLSELYPQPLLTLDQDRRITAANQSAVRLLGDCIGEELPEEHSFQLIPLYDKRNKLYRSIAIQQKNTTETAGKLKGKEQLYTFADIFGQCPHISKVIELARKAARYPLPVLLMGESGTGKELFAQAIHRESGRGPFIAVNCSAIPDTLIESELFGYEKGAFTGANKDGSIGKFLAADGGTLFLDEIGDMSLRSQAALLRVLQEKTVTPVGSVYAKRIDVRIIAATHRDLYKLVQEGAFRADLYYRLKGIVIQLPALRQRSDLTSLVEYLLRKHTQPPSTCSPEALALLSSYSWPGNIRELLSVLLQASFLAEDGIIQPEHIILDIPDEEYGKQSFSLREQERKIIEEVLRKTEGNIAMAAQLLNIGRNTLYRKIKAYGIRQPNLKRR